MSGLRRADYPRRSRPGRERGYHHLYGATNGLSDVNVLGTSSKRSALYTAVVGGHEGAARKIILAGADVNYVDPVDGFPSLIPAVCCCGSALLVTDLLIAGAIPGSYHDQESDEDFSPLRIAAAAGRGEVVSALLIANASMTFRDHRGNTALMRASERGCLATVTALLAAGADVTVRERGEYQDGKNAHEIAIGCGHTDIVQAIVFTRT